MGKKLSLEKERRRNYNAGSKAVRDVTEILHKSGYSSEVFDAIHPNRMIQNLLRILRVGRLYFVVGKNDVCFLQWPLMTKIGIDRLLYTVLKYKRPRLQLLIHDLTSVRTGQNGDLEKKFLMLAESIIAHTSEMKTLLVSWGIEAGRIKVLSSFDYLVVNGNDQQRQLSSEVVFAGNLAKSDFLWKMCDEPLGFSLLCYGSQTPLIREPLVYCGRFDADDVSGIRGSWGLVWDGEDIDTCNGQLGDYLRINSPHKVSLYIVARLPIIIWREAALASYVRQKGIGILVSSLREISDAIASVTEDDYREMLSNIDKERAILTVGGHLRACLYT